MNFFDIIRNLFFSKKADTEILDHDSAQAFTPFMVNRWLTFYSREQTTLVNETLNKFTSLFDDKGEMYKLYFNLIPKLRYKKIEYVKKKKTKETDSAKDISKELETIARSNLISQREVQQYIDLLDK